MIYIKLFTGQPAGKKFRVVSYRKLARKHVHKDIVSKFVVLGRTR